MPQIWQQFIIVWSITESIKEEERGIYKLQLSQSSPMVIFVAQMMVCKYNHYGVINVDWNIQTLGKPYEQSWKSVHTTFL